MTIIGTRVFEDTVESVFGVPAPAPAPLTAPPTSGSSGAPTLSSTPGQSLSLTASGGLPTTLTNGLLQLISSGQHKIAFGAGTLTFSASTTADSVITHGMGSKPVCLIAVADVDSLGFFYCTVFGASTTQFTVRGISTAGVQTGTPTFYWFAIS